MHRLLILLFLLSSFLVGCTSKPQKVIRIGINAWPGYEFLSLAEQLGYYNEEGVEVKLIPFLTLADCKRAFEKQQIDVMAGTLVEFYSARDVHATDPVIFMVADFSNGGDVLLANKAFPRIADLKGKRVGFEVGSVDVLTAANALASASLGFDDITLVPMTQTSNIKALLAGEIDAAQTYPPFSIEALANPNIVRLFDTSQTPGAIVDILFAPRGLLTAHHVELVKIVRAFERAVDYYHTHPEDATARMAAREGITASEFADAMNGLKIVEQQDSYLTQGDLLTILIKTHKALIDVKAINGPVCSRECFSDIAKKPPNS